MLVHRELDKLDAALATLDEEGATAVNGGNDAGGGNPANATPRHEIAARLRAWLARIDGPVRTGGGAVDAGDAGEDDDLDTVTDEEMFDLIDRELDEI